MRGILFLRLKMNGLQVLSNRNIARLTDSSTILINFNYFPGTPSTSIWPEYPTLPAIQNFRPKQQPYNNIKEKFPLISKSGIRLLNYLFMYDPKKRATASECLDNSYFKEAPTRKFLSPRTVVSWKAFRLLSGLEGSLCIFKAFVG